MGRGIETPLYATLLYKVREELDISWVEYVYLDMVHKLSNGRWCVKSLLHCANDLGITRRHLIRIKNLLLEAGLIEKNLRGHIRVTSKFTSVAVTYSHQQASQVVTKSPQVVTKSHLKGDKMSLIENNNRITIDNKERASRKTAEAVREALKAKGILKRRLT